MSTPQERQTLETFRTSVRSTLSDSEIIISSQKYKLQTLSYAPDAKDMGLKCGCAEKSTILFAGPYRALTTGLSWNHLERAPLVPDLPSGKGR